MTSGTKVDFNPTAPLNDSAVIRLIHTFCSRPGLDGLSLIRGRVAPSLTPRGVSFQDSGARTRSLDARTFAATMATKIATNKEKSSRPLRSLGLSTSLACQVSCQVSGCSADSRLVTLLLFLSLPTLLSEIPRRSFLRSGHSERDRAGWHWR
jgi:hypothetical protein